MTLNAIRPVTAATTQKYIALILFNTNKVSVVIKKMIRNIDIICFSFIITNIMIKI